VYTVTCSSCGHAIELAFARHGAAGRCPSCRRVVTVDDATLRVEGATPLTPPPPAARLDPETPRLDAEGNVIGLSGLSHLLKQTGRAAHRDAKAGQAASHKPADPARRPALSPTAMPRQGLILIVAAVAVVGLLGLAIWYITLTPQVPAADPAPPAQPPAAADPDAP